MVPRPTQLSILLWSVHENQLRLGRQRQVRFIPFVDKRVGLQVKLWNPSTTCAIPERFCIEVSSVRGAISSIWSLSSACNCDQWSRSMVSVHHTAARAKVAKRIEVLFGMETQRSKALCVKWRFCSSYCWIINLASYYYYCCCCCCYNYCAIFVDQMVSGALLSSSSLRPPTPANIDSWSSTSALDNINSLTNHLTGLHAALPYNLHSLSDISEGTFWLTHGFGVLIQYTSAGDRSS